MDTKKTIEEETKRVLNLMSLEEVGSDKYMEYLKVYKELVEIKKKRFTISPDILINAATNLIGILLVINHENLNVITSKSFGLIKRT